MQCIRCGTTISEGRLFCDTCSAQVSTPLDDAEVRRLVLPDRTKTPPAPKPVKKAAPAPRSRRRLVTAVVVLSLCCALLLGGVGFGAYEWFFGSLHRANSRQVLMRAENTRLNVELDRLEEAISVAEEEQRTLEDARQADARKLQRLEEELNLYHMQSGDLSTDLAALEQENILLLDRLDEAAGAQHDLNRRIEELEAALQTQESQNASLQQMSAWFSTQLAFVPEDGTGYYHRYGCAYCNADQSAILRVSDAQAQGCTPCPYCHAEQTQEPD